MNINLDEFKKSDLRIGKVIAAERVEGSEKLLRMQIDLGDRKEGGDGASESGADAAADMTMPRQILSGIGKVYTPEEMIGKSVVIIANLEPRMMMGFESQGMLLAASDAEGKPVILTIDGNVSAGTKIT